MWNAGTRYRDEWPIAIGGLTCVVAYVVSSRTGDLDGHRPRLALVVLGCWLVFGVAAWVALRRPPSEPDPGRNRRRLTVVVLLTAVCQLPGVLVPPQSSSDAYRYVWDGRVQLAGVSPYRYVPLDDRLAELRDPLLFPGLRPSQASGVRTLDRLPRARADVLQLARNDPRTRINRPRVPTIYPPVAQAWFSVVAALTPRSRGTQGLQLAAALLALALTLGLGLLLGRRGRDPAQALYWGWCPLVVLETGNGAHVDILATALILGALAVLGGRGITTRPQWISRVVGGLLLGLAAATKIIPLLLLPALTVLRRRHNGGPREFAVPVTAIGTFALSYLPHVLAVGALVLGYLPGYLNEEGFSDGGSRYGVLALVLPTAAREPVALLLAALLALLALWRCDRDRPERTAVWLFGGAVLITTPAYAWYCLPLVALAVLAGRLEWLAVPVAGYLAYAGIRTPHLPEIAYAAAGVVVLLVALSRSSRRDHAQIRGPGDAGLADLRMITGETSGEISGETSGDFSGGGRRFQRRSRMVR
jgi:glycosyl transferase family 87